jgi:hypothetical protein
VEALARALPQMAHLTTLELRGTTSPALCALNSMNGLPRLGHGFAESFVGSVLCGWEQYGRMLYVGGERCGGA